MATTSADIRASVCAVLLFRAGFLWHDGYVYLIGEQRPIASDFRLQQYLQGIRDIHIVVSEYIQIWAARQGMRDDFSR
jgi:hypothetical protein